MTKYLGGILVAVAATLSLAGAANAAGQDAVDRCRVVAELLGRNESTSTYQQKVADSAYDQVCSDKSTKAGLDFSSTSTAIVELVPVKSGFNFGGRKEKAEHFCSTHTKSSNAEIYSTGSSSVVVKEAIAAWAGCVGLNDQVHIEIKENATPAGITIELKRGKEDAQFQGIVVKEGKLDCSAHLPGFLGNRRRNVDANTTVNLTSDALVISCARPKTDSPVEGVYLTQVSADIVTSRGSVTVVMPRDIRLGHAYASQLLAELSDTRQHMAQSNAYFEQEIRRLNKRRPEFKNVCYDLTNDNCGRTIACPSGWTKAFPNNNTWNGGRCGRGYVCDTCYRMVD